MVLIWQIIIDILHEPYMVLIWQIVMDILLKHLIIFADFSKAACHVPWTKHRQRCPALSFIGK